MKSRKEMERAESAHDVESIKLHSKMRELRRMKEELDKVKDNNRLIKAIESLQSEKINGFFQEFEEYINVKSDKLPLVRLNK